MHARSSTSPSGPIFVSPIKNLSVSQYTPVEILHEIGPRVIPYFPLSFTFNILVCPTGVKILIFACLFNLYIK